jgi:uncharacterized repeat protein (TIGR03803 family)
MNLLLRVLLAAALMLPALGAQAAWVFTNLHSFQVFSNGANPYAGLVEGNDGSFYGTTYYGGTNGGHGAVFKLGTNGTLTSLYSFTGGNDGSNPQAGLVLGSNGNFYGTTSLGGTNSSGTVFQIGANGAFTSLCSLSGYYGGANPYAGLVQGKDGNFYGTTSSGGTNSYGTVFQLSAQGLLTSLYSFTGGSDGANPEAGLVLASDGNLYGTTYDGGTSNAGTVFQFSTNGALTSLYSFTGGNDGGYPLAGLVLGSDGNFYGTTAGGGTNDYGTVFQFSTKSGLTSLYSFTNGNDGVEPEAGLVQGGDGNFYGTTYVGGTNGYGTVFQISTSGALASLYSFTGGDDGAYPQAGLVLGSDGNFRGTTYEDGTNGAGTVFKISAHGALTGSYAFTGGNDGANPEAGLVQGSNGNFYGTTESGGAYYIRDEGMGTVFQISPNGTLASLYVFTNSDVGAYPEAGLVLGSDGNFHGTTYDGGTNDFGAVFSISTNGTLTNLYSFGYNDGANPEAGLVQDSDGNFYGTTDDGGANDDGTVFKINTNGALTTLYSFGMATNANGDPLDGAFPEAGLARGSDGNFYGTTSFGGSNGWGTVFQIGADGGLKSLHSFGMVTNEFGYPLDGGYPAAGLVLGSDGDFYGTTSEGGTNGYGNVFQISTSGALTSLYSFTAGNDGAFPKAGLIQGSDGNFYGTTEYGGGNDNGTVFQIGANGALTSLYVFTGGNDGGVPVAGLVQGSDGSFYGTTQYGGQGGNGTVFRLTATRAAPFLLTATLIGKTLFLTWSTEIGGMYQLQDNSGLISSNWANLSTPFTAAGTNLSATVTIASSQQRFYRVILLP